MKTNSRVKFPHLFPLAKRKKEERALLLKEDSHFGSLTPITYVCAGITKKEILEDGGRHTFLFKMP